MNLIFSRCRRLLVSSIAGGLLIAASPASATLYVLQFHTAAQTGQVYFTAPDWTTPGALPGQINGIEVINSFEITTARPGSSFNHSGVSQRIQSIVPIGSFTNAFAQPNDNKLLTFSNELSTIPASSNFDPHHPLVLLRRLRVAGLQHH